MPGMNLIHYFSNGGVRPAPEISRVLTSVGMPDDPIQTLIEDRFYHLSCKAYPGYPFVFWENNLFYFYLEGYLYGLSQKEMRTALEYLAEVIFLQDKNTNRISAWVSNTDGDFLIWIGDKKNGRSAIINDRFGRLPVYYLQRSDEVLVSRDVRFITKVCGQCQFDRLGVAHQLLMGHGMGELTPWKDIRRLNPASLFPLNFSRGRVAAKSLYSYDFSSKRYRDVSLTENAGRLVELFLQSCTSRAGLSNLDVVSLSGGLDSRSVAAGLASSGRPFTAVTFYKAAYQKREESQIARTVANLLGSPFHLIEVRGATAQIVLKLLRLKNGLNSLGMGFLVEFFENIRARLGPDLTYFTGEFGDRALPFIRAAWPLTSLKSLTHYILDSNYHDNFCLKIEDVAALTGIRREDLVESIADHLAGYPEESWADKNLHYKIYDRAFRVYNEAEDRNRCYFWSVAPFFAIYFFDYAMNCPDRQKAGYNLYKRFLSTLSPSVRRVPVSGANAGMDSLKFFRYYLGTRLKKVRPRWTRRTKHLVKGEDSFFPQAEVIGTIERQVVNCPEILNYLNPEHLRRILSPAAKYHKWHIMNLFTLVSTIEDFTCHRSSLEDFPERVLF